MHDDSPDAVALVAGALCYLALAAAVFAFAGDVAAWRDAISMDDVRYRVAPGEEDLWQPAAVLPFGIAGDALSVGDDVRFRNAVRALRLGRLELGITSDPKLALFRRKHERGFRRSPEVEVIGGFARGPWACSAC